MEEVLQQRDNKHSKRNQMSIKTVSVEQTMENTMELKWKVEIRWGGMGLRWGVVSEVTPFGPTGDGVQPPRKGGVVTWNDYYCGGNLKSIR